MISTGAARFDATFRFFVSPFLEFGDLVGEAVCCSSAVECLAVGEVVCSSAVGCLSLKGSRQWM